MKILIVEDSRSSLLLLSQYIEAFGARAVPAASGEAAVAAFAAEQPDLVLLDVVLPDIDGHEVARRIRAIEGEERWVPIIFLSSMAGDEDIEKGIAAGGDDYLIKPVSEIVLGAKIRAMQRIVRMRAALVDLTRRLDAANNELKRLSAIDGLTGIANRRQFDERLDQEWRRARRAGGSVALLMCDIDYFKQYNDRYGHQAGDDCLRRVAAAIAQTMERGADLAARYGGEEFSAILPDTPLGGALFVAEKIRHAVHQLNQPHAGSPLGRVTLSIGVASLPADAGQTYEALIQAADQALYRAKHEGRDRVCRAETAVA
ncbi:diguanylate cyclase [Azonexus sp.]|uniref:diguanylate cyclase n=1 Tax=Azonexus sp. TaxID=1872668 RepID=UPI0035AFB73B